jgi:hypothetical protein
MSKAKKLTPPTRAYAKALRAYAKKHMAGGSVQFDKSPEVRFTQREGVREEWVQAWVRVNNLEDPDPENFGYYGEPWCEHMQDNDSDD